MTNKLHKMYVRNLAYYQSAQRIVGKKKRTYGITGRKILSLTSRSGRGAPSDLRLQRGQWYERKRPLMRYLEHRSKGIQYNMEVKLNRSRNLAVLTALTAAARVCIGI